MRAKRKLNLNVIKRWYVLLVVAPVLILAALLIRYAKESSQERQLEMARRNLNSMIITAERNMGNVENLFSAVCYDMELLNFLSQPYGTDSYYTYHDQIQPRLRLIQTAASPGIVSLTMYMKNETIPAGYGIFEHFSEFPAALELEGKLDHAGGSWMLREKEDSHRLCYVQGIYAAYSDELLGILEAEVSAEWLLLLNQEFSGEIWIRDGELLYANSAKEPPAFAEGIRLSGQEIITCHRLESLGLELVAVQEEAPNPYLGIYVFLFLIVLGASLLIYLFLIRSVVRDANNMILQIRRSADNEFRGYVGTQSRFELAIIAEKFNEIMEEIHRLIEDNVEKRLAQREAQITAMQCQISPHMLCNSLQIIQYQMELQQQYDISHYVAVLGRIMRYGIEDRSIMTSVELEVEHLKLYVEFQRLRFEPGELELCLVLDETLSKCSMLKLTLQPIVENALIHGKLPGKPIRITVRIQRQGNSIRFQISNTGRKLTEEALLDMRRLLCEPENSIHSKSMGLRNLNRRNILCYSPQSALQFLTDPEGYTVVAFEIPLQNPVAATEAEKLRVGGDRDASGADIGR